VEERLHKLLAQHGLGSRRQVEEWIRAGRILINGQPASIGQRVRSSDRIVVDGKDVSKRVSAPQKLRVIAYHKPSGELLRGRVGDERSPVDARLPSLRAGRWLPINTVGFAEDGLLLLTNDGALAAAAGRRGRELPVEYRVRVLRPRDAVAWPAIPRSVETDGQRSEFTTVEAIEAAGSNVWFRVEAARAVARGAVRTLFDAAGLKVSRILLLRWGSINLPRDLPRGRSRELTGEDRKFLLGFGAGSKTAEPPRAARRGGRKHSPRAKLRRSAAPRSGGR
jgi:23S rRNA pseudouridine2605 synthase